MVWERRLGYMELIVPGYQSPADFSSQLELVLNLRFSFVWWSCWLQTLQSMGRKRLKDRTSVICVKISKSKRLQCLAILLHLPDDDFHKLSKCLDNWKHYLRINTLVEQGGAWLYALHLWPKREAVKLIPPTGACSSHFGTWKYANTWE